MIKIILMFMNSRLTILILGVLLISASASDNICL